MRNSSPRCIRARIIERHDSEPPPPPLVERDPNLKSWSAYLIGGKKMQL
jgi:hypothetical protein